MPTTNMQTAAYIVAYVTFFFGCLSLAARLYTRTQVLKIWGWDDNLAIIIGLVSCGQQVVLHLFLYWGCGLPIATLTPVQQGAILKVLFVEEVWYYVTHFVIKLALLLFYIHLSPNKVFRAFVYIGFATNAAIFVINNLLAFLQCTPFDAIINPAVHPEAKCMDKMVLFIVPSVLNIMQDLYILILPVSTVLSLQMTLRRKLAVISVLSFGASAVIVAAFRLLPLLELGSNPDVSYVLGKMVIVAALEIQFAVIAVNLPPLKALWMKWTGGSSNGSNMQSGAKAYKLGSINKGREGDSKASKGRSKRGSVTRMEHGDPGTESEEELFKQAGLRGKTADNGDVISITTEAVRSEEHMYNTH
ncbi:hypothetical protein P280DRAFT_465739 [Massarina eburnea CBS 473.64]|uniref:Rhodopsin domain-containing protein n=1 Tax=Massarina eburnea CBS 473.64 TaxID=1395130 RepID=A0A6A6SDT1_9PLEO|nr:hypothetical protein P280DRAFT_465739 [Massarina eburnea CBS 473.64]